MNVAILPSSGIPGVDFTIRQGDTLPNMVAALTDGNGNAIDLTACTVALLLFSEYPQPLTQVTLAGTLTVTEPEFGQVQYAWASADTSVAGSYQAVFQITTPGLATETVPNAGHLNIVIQPAL